MPTVSPIALPNFTAGQFLPQVERSSVHQVFSGQRHTELEPGHAQGVMPGSGQQAVRFSGGVKQGVTAIWNEHQQWFPRQRLRIASELEALTNKIRKVIAGIMMVLPTVVPVPKWLYKRISKDYFFSPRKVFDLKFADPELNRIVRSQSFQVEPGSGNLNMIHSFYLQAEKGKPTIVFSHGRDTNIGYLEDLFKEAKAKGYGFFAYDYPGFGKSDGIPDDVGLGKAGVAACRFLAGEGYGGSGFQVPYGQQIIMGYSLGGAAAVHTAREFALDAQRALPERLFKKGIHPDGGQPKGLVLINTFTDIRELFMAQLRRVNQSVAKYFDTSRIELQLNSKEKIKDVTLPVMVFHCEKDNLIPQLQGKELKDSATKAGMQIFKPLHGNGHGFKKQQCQQVLEELKPLIANG